MLRLNRIVAMFLVAMAFAASSGEATNKTFPAGTYIIPMDSVYQPSADGGIFEAYGLVFDLLQNGATVYWIIDETKTLISAPDMTITNTTTTPVVAGFTGTAIPAPAITTTISYSGAPFVIVPGEGITVASQEAILGHADWAAVEIHKTNVPFTANVSRELKGTPPQIALLNNQESTASGTGNAQILESYMSLAGICNDTYDIVTPNQVRDGILDTGGYTVFWAPHWTAYSGWTGGNAADADAIMLKIRQFLEAGNSIFAECASIEVMEHSYNGHYLTTNSGSGAPGSVTHSGGISHDGGTMDPLKIVYHDTTSPFPQIGDYTFTPTSGHLHNWAPWRSSNYLAANHSGVEAYPFTPVPTVETSYNPTVSRFTYDDKDGLASTPLDQWDYYTGGRIDGNENMGYVVYLGGHKYGTCSTGGGGGAVGPVNERIWKFTMEDNISTSTTAASKEIYTIEVVYTYNGLDYTITAPLTDGAGMSTAGALGSSTVHPTLIFPSGADKLELDFSDAVRSGKVIDAVSVRNKGTFPVTIKSIRVSWTNGAAQHTDKLQDTGTSVYLYNPPANQANGYTYDSTHNLIAGYPTIDPPAPPAVGGVGGCVNNSGCTWSSVAGVRYVLNTLFNLQYTVVDTTYIRSSPVVIDGSIGGVTTGLMYQGSFDYPSMGGHVRVFNVSSVTAGSELLDLATSVPAASGRNLKTSMDGTTLIDFNAAQLSSDTAFQNALSLSVTYASAPTTYNNVVNRIRGVDTKTGADKANRLGGVEHSAVAIVKPYSRSNPTRHTMAYFGTLDGILEAFDVDSLHGGAGSPTEVWGYVPKGQLASLQNIRNQPSSVQPYPGVDASPTVAELLYDHDANPATNNWRTIMTTLTGKYGASPSVIAFDITDPTAPDLLWEKTRADAGLSLMGAGMRASMGVAKDAAGNPVPTVFAATNKKVTVGAVPPEHGGVQGYAFNLFTGNLLWQFSADYSGSQNDLPGAITAIDKDQDGSEDVVLIGDMDGRLWKLDALTGANLMGAGVPLFDAGVNYPIAASPSITADKNGNLLAVFGTGGADWAPADAAHIHHIFAVNLETGVEVWNIPLNAGEKAYGSPTIAHESVYVTTAYGTMESANPSDDLNSTAQRGNLRAINLETGAVTSTTEVGNMRGAVYVKGGKAYTSTLDGQVSEIDLGYTSGGVNALKLLWKQQ